MSIFVRSFFVGCALCLVGCERDAGMETSVQVRQLADVPAERLEQLSKRSFFFAHQSVGGNILDGLARVLKDNPEIRLNAVAGEDAAELKPGVILHTQIGSNGKPQTKIDGFERVLAQGIGGKADAAFLKFCYVDAGRDSDMKVEELFQRYKRSSDALKVQYPHTVFVHFTMPIRTVPGGIKVAVKNLIGREIPEYLDNVERGHFNDLLRKQYAGKEPLFDVAHLESIAAGRTYGFTYQGQTFEAMAPQNTYDGGHLSDDAKRWMAEQLLIFLAQLDYRAEISDN